MRFALGTPPDPLPGHRDLRPLPGPKHALSILNMRSAAADRRGDDRSTRARIRDAAVGFSGPNGHARTTARAVSTAAGVATEEGR